MEFTEQERRIVGRAADSFEKGYQFGGCLSVFRSVDANGRPSERLFDSTCVTVNHWNLLRRELPKQPRNVVESGCFAGHFWMACLREDDFSFDDMQKLRR